MSLRHTIAPASTPWPAIGSKRFQAMLFAAFLLLAGSAVGGGVLTSHHQRALRAAARYDASWDAARIFADWLQLETAVADMRSGTAAAGEEAQLRLELVQSALGHLVEGEVASSFAADATFPALRQRMADALGAVSAAIAGQAAPEAVLDDLRRVNPAIGRLASRLHAAQLEATVAQDVRLAHQQVLVAGLMAAAVLCGLMLVGALAWHNRRLRQAEAEVRASEARTALALEAAGAGWWTIQPSRQFACSRRAWALCGQDAPPAPDPGSLDRWLRTIHPEDRADVARALSAPRHAMDSIRLHFRVLVPESTRWLLAVGQWLPDANGRLTIYGILVDETERVLKQQALTSARERAEHAAATKSRMLAETSHDLRQPLQSMFLIASRLQAETPSDGRSGLLRSLDDALDTMHGLLSDLNDMASAEHGQLRPKVQGFPLGVLLAEIEGAYAPRAEAKACACRSNRRSCWCAATATCSAGSCATWWRTRCAIRPRAAFPSPPGASRDWSGSRSATPAAASAPNIRTRSGAPSTVARTRVAAARASGSASRSSGASPICSATA